MKKLPAFILIGWGALLVIGGFSLTLLEHGFVGFWSILAGCAIGMFGVTELDLRS